MRTNDVTPSRREAEAIARLNAGTTSSPPRVSDRMLLVAIGASVGLVAMALTLVLVAA